MPREETRYQIIMQAPKDETGILNRWQFRAHGAWHSKEEALLAKAHYVARGYRVKLLGGR